MSNRRKTSSGSGFTSAPLGEVCPCPGPEPCPAIGKPSKNQLTSSSDKADSPRLSFSSQKDALDYARHVVEDSKRRLAAYNFIERYLCGDYYICVGLGFRHGNRNLQKYDFIFSPIPFKQGNRYPNGAINVIRPDFVDLDIRDNIHLGEFPVLVCDTHAVKREEKVISSFVWLERAKKRYDVCRNIFAAAFDNFLQFRSILGKRKVGTFGGGNSRSNSNSISRMVKGSPEMLNSFSSMETEYIGKGLKKSDFVQIINTTLVTLYDFGPLISFVKSPFPSLEGINVVLCAREPEF
ncbi:MAG: hypothetical protein ACLQED_07055 [Desulfobaccales bacterium]